MRKPEFRQSSSRAVQRRFVSCGSVFFPTKSSLISQSEAQHVEHRRERGVDFQTQFKLPSSGEAYLVIRYVRTFQRRHDEAVAAGEKAVALSPSGADAYHMAGMYHGYAGNFREAALYEERAQLLSPFNVNVSMVDEARARFHLGDFKAARDIALRVLKEKPSWLTARSTLVAALWNLGREEEARILAKELLARHPGFSVARWAHSLPYRHQEHLDALIKPLRLAGLPE